MIKNLIISGFCMRLLFQLSPYTFGTTEAIISTIAGMAVITVLLCDIDHTIIEHVAYRNRKKFRRLIGITDLRREA